MGAITAVEDYLLARIKGDVLGTKLRGLDSLPAAWDEATIERALRLTPGAFVSFLGGTGGRSTALQVALDSRWSITAVTSHASGEAARRRGDTQEIGAYEIIEQLVPLFHSHTIPDVGTLRLVDVANLFSEGQELRGVSAYSATFALELGLPLTADPATLDDFTTFHAEWSVDGPDTANPEDNLTGLNQ